MAPRFSWNEAKRQTNLSRHGLDFADVPSVFEGSTFTFEDDRFAYGEQRFVTLVYLVEVAVSIVHLESPAQIHVISFRKATRHEDRILLESLRGLQN